MPRPPSIARSIFEDILVRHEGYDSPAEYLRAMVNSSPPTYEGAHLEFKGGAIFHPDNDPNALPRHWSEALAGFATTSGGVLVFGIIAKKDSTGVDHAIGLDLVDNPERLKTQLKKLATTATDPPVGGVEIETVMYPNEPDRGFVVCLIPESPFKPHRSEHNSKENGKRYLIRVGDSFVETPPSVLRSLFYPGQASHLKVACKPKITTILDKGTRYYMDSRYEIWIQNDGPATARNLLVKVNILPELGYTALHHFTGSQVGSTMRYQCEVPLHPGDRVPCCRPTTIAKSQNLAIDPNLRLEPVEVIVNVLADNQDPRAFRIQVSPEQLRSGQEIIFSPVELDDATD